MNRLAEASLTRLRNWGLSPEDAMEWLRENMLPYYPLGVYKDVRAEGFANAAEAAAARAPGPDDCGACEEPVSIAEPPFEDAPGEDGSGGGDA